MYAPLPATMLGAGAGAAAVWPAYVPMCINLKNHTFHCMDLEYEQNIEVVDGEPRWYYVLPLDMCVWMKVSNWFGEYILSMMDKYVCRISTPANQVNVWFFEPKYQVFSA